MVEGVTNGVISKYDKNCLDIVPQNAKDEIKGNAPSDHSGFKCYKDGKPVDWRLRAYMWVGIASMRG